MLHHANRALSPLQLPGHAPATPKGPPVEDVSGEGGGERPDGEEPATGLCLCPSWAHGPNCRYVPIGTRCRPALRIFPDALPPRQGAATSGLGLRSA